MKIFIICCLLFIHVNMRIYIKHMFIENPYFSYYVAIQSGFRVSAGSVLGTNYHPNWCSMRFWVSGLGAQRLHPIRIRPVAIPRGGGRQGGGSDRLYGWTYGSDGRNRKVMWLKEQSNLVYSIKGVW